MQFVHPEVLWALLALTIPVLVHLFSFRRHRKVAFSQTAFLKELRMESRSRNRIRNWLILLMRLAAMSAIILAFAEPFWPAEGDENQGGQKLVSLYLDTSPSMELEGRNGPMLEAAKSGALALVESHAVTDRFHVVSSTFEASDRRWLTKEEALERIASLQPGHAAPGIRDVLLHQQEFLSSAEADQRHAYLFTDLQASSHALTGETSGMVDSSMVVRFISQQAQPQVNIRVDSAWFDTPMRLVGRSEVLHVRITHDATRPVDALPLSVNINGRKAAIGSYRIVPGLPTDTVLRFRHETSGPVHAVVSTTDAPVTFDDALHIGYSVAENVQVTLVQGRASTPAEQVALGRLFGDAALHEVQSMDAAALDYGTLESADLIVLQGVRDPSNGLVGALLRNVEAGKSLLMLPPASPLGEGWNELLLGLGGQPVADWVESETPVRLGTLHHTHPLFEGVFARDPRRVDLPTVKGWHTRSRNGSLERDLLSFADGRPFLTTGLSGLGRYHFCAAPLDAAWSNLSQHALLVPMTLRMAETSRATGLQQFTSGEEVAVLLQGLEGATGARLALRPTSGDAGTRTMLEAGPVPGGVEVYLPLREATPGTYFLETITPTSSGVDSAQVVMALGINPSRSESDLEVWDATDLKQALLTEGWKRSDVLSSDVEDVVEEVEELEAGQPLWLSLIALSLMFLLIEMSLLKRKSALRSTHESATS
ncbi:MAG: BatA domain-containing protein [Flavobacteriales bacterium]|nr:BatA domain-containing protein [Flavobacteriales bacterium]